MERASREYRVEWNINPYQSPVIINQCIVSPGPPASDGPDGLVYLHFGHVSPPVVFDEQDVQGGVLQVTPSGSFVFTKQRAVEFRDLLTRVIEGMEEA